MEHVASSNCPRPSCYIDAARTRGRARACADARESKTPGIGKEWLSGIDGREHDWNGFVREYIDRELVLDGWIERRRRRLTRNCRI